MILNDFKGYSVVSYFSIYIFYYRTIIIIIIIIIIIADRNLRTAPMTL